MKRNFRQAPAPKDMTDTEVMSWLDENDWVPDKFTEEYCDFVRALAHEIYRRPSIK